MKLSEKGRYTPRPTLDAPAESVACAVEQWSSVLARTHWELGDESIVDGADFYVGERELGHLHLYREAHIRVPKELREALIDAGFGSPFRWSKSFLVHRVCTAEEARATEWLFRLAYDRLEGESIPALLERIRARTKSKPEVSAN